MHIYIYVLSYYHVNIIYIHIYVHIYTTFAFTIWQHPRKIAKSCVGQNTKKELVLSQQILSYKKKLDTLPPYHFCSSIFQYQPNSSNNKNIFSPVSFPSFPSSPEIFASFSVFVSGFAQLSWLFGVEVSRPSSCFKL